MKITRIVMQNHLYEILKKLLVKNNIKINNEELKLQLSSHPSYPSLHALTGVLDHFNIPNLALRLVVNEEILDQLPSIFIANLVNDQTEALALIEKKKDGVIIIDSEKSKRISNQEFLKRWKGVIVAIEKDEAINETKENPIIKPMKWVLALTGFSVLGFLMYTHNNFFANSHLVLSIIGFVLSIFIVKHELGLNSNATNSFCNLSEKTSCDAVLNSKGASVFGLFKLSDISIVMFSAYCLCWVLLGVSGSSNFSVVSIVTLLAFPFVLYSIYYQYNVVKKWCPLCLVIAAVLTVQMSTLLLSGFSIKEVTFDVQTLAAFLIPVIASAGVLGVLKPLFLRKESLEKTEVAYYKFKRNFSFFNVLLNEGDALSSYVPIPGEISLGNPNANVRLILVTSPMCFYCKKAHRDMEQLLSRIGNQIHLTIRFNVNTAYKDNNLYKVASKLLQIYNTKEENNIIHALDEVYKDDANLDEWVKSKDLSNMSIYNPILDKQRDWCKANVINFTPALYINKRQFPKEYDRLDLIYFIDDLIEQQDLSSFSVNTTEIAS